MNSSQKRWIGKVLPPLVLFLVVVVAWDLAVTTLHVRPYLVPRPMSVLNAAQEHHKALLSATALTAGAALCGLAASLIIGAALALVFSQSRMIQRAVYPYAIFLQTAPIIAIAPLVIKWFGTGFLGVAVVAFIISLFPIITNATAGLTTVDASLLELFNMYNASRWQTLVKLRLPNAVPYLVTGAKISCGLSVIGAIVGETVAGGGESFGLGYLITLTSGQLKTDYAFAALICSTLLGVVIFSAVSVLGNWLLSRRGAMSVEPREDSVE